MSALEFKLPDIGEGVHEGEIVKWIVAEGDSVEEDDPVVEVMTDKATVEIPAPASGVVKKHHVAEGDTANVGDVLFTMDEGGEGGGDAGDEDAGEADEAAAAETEEDSGNGEVAAGDDEAAEEEDAAADEEEAGAAEGEEAGGDEDEEDAGDDEEEDAAASGDTLEFKLPDIGEGVHEGEIVKWIVAEGDSVEEDDPVVEVMTDKATVEIPAPAAGTVTEHRVSEGDTAQVGDVLFVIQTGDGGGDAKPKKKGKKKAAKKEGKKDAKAAAKKEKKAAPKKESQKEAPASSDKKVLAAPATRRLARELDVDLTEVNGSGPRGRVKPEDVRAAADGARKAAEKPAADKPAAAAEKAPAGEAPAAPMPSFARVEGAREVEKIPFRGIRRKTAEAMTRSKFTATHFSLIEEVDCTEMVAARHKAKAVGERHGIKVTYMPYIMKACGIALQEFPQLNAELDEDEGVILQKQYVNLGIAVDTPNGLVVPVVPDVHLKGLLQLSAELTDVAVRAREGKLKPDDFADGTFSITNAGNIGGVFATPIINFPEVAILGVHTMRKMPRCVGDDIVARDVMMLSISIDHRLVDGADGARFMVRMRELLEEPGLMLL